MNAAAGRLSAGALPRAVGGGLVVRRERLFVFLLYFAFLAPAFPNYLEGTAGLTYFGVIVFQMACGALFTLFVLTACRYPKSGALEAACVVAGFFLLLTFISIMRQSWSETSTRDFFEFYRPFSALVFFLAGYGIAWNDEKLKRCVIRPLRNIIFIEVVLGLAEAYTVVGRRFGDLLYNSDRPVFNGKALGSLGQTYFFATFMLLPVFWFFFRGMSGGRTVRNLFLSLLCAFMVLTSQSRTCLAALSFGGLYIAGFYFVHLDAPKRLRVLALVAAVVVAAAVFAPKIPEFMAERYPYAYAGLSRVLREGVVLDSGRSEAIRVKQLLTAWELQDPLPLVGVGIGKAAGLWLESFYALYLFRYGLPAMFVWLGILFWFWRASLRCFKDARRRRNKETAAFFLGLHVFLAVAPVTMVASAVYDMARLSVLYYALLGVTARYLLFCRDRKASGAVAWEEWSRHTRRPAPAGARQ